MTPRELYNETLNQKGLIEKSIYVNVGTKLIRYSNHVANSTNVITNNDGITEMLLVFTDFSITEKEMQNNVDDLSSVLGIDVDYLFYNEEIGLDYVKAIINRFINQ